MRIVRGNAVAALTLVAALGATLPGSAMPSGPAIPSSPEAVPGRFLVKVSRGSSAGALHRAAGATRVRPLAGLPGWDLVATPSRVTLRAQRAAYPRSVLVEPDFVARAAAASPSDPCVWDPCAGAAPWNLTMVRAPLGWDAYPGAALSAVERQSADPVPVAVLDTRIDSTHPDFRNAGGASGDVLDGGQIDWSSGRSWVAASKRSGPSSWHGTFVAGILGAAAGNGVDLAGVGFPSMLLPFEVLDGSGASDAASVAEAVVAAGAAGARIVNMSLGLTGDSQAVHDAIRAVTSGPEAALVVAAAGNNTKDAPFYPGSYSEVMSVAGVDAAGAPASCSNYNDNVSVAAPAKSVLSLAPMPQRLRVIDCGTSAAAPHVSGLAALLMMQDRSRSAAQIRAIIERTARDDAARPGWDSRLGFGVVDVDRALREPATTLVDSVSATGAARGGGTSTIVATARSASGVAAAEAYLDRPGDPSARIPLRAADGSWGGSVERVTADVTIPASDSSTVHTVFVRAFDGSWGPSAVGRLVVDRTPPQITNIRAQTFVRATTEKGTISFTLADDTATRLSYTVTVRSPDGAPAWESGRVRAVPGPQAVYWTPPRVGLAGPFGVEIWAWDEAGNPGAATTSAIVV